jgi:hypothetical protein
LLGPADKGKRSGSRFWDGNAKISKKVALERMKLLIWWCFLSKEQHSRIDATESRPLVEEIGRR